jgi:hypothetical protein
MNVLFISPGFPIEMPLFVRGLASAGARVYGLGEQAEGTLPDGVRSALSGYLQVRSLWDEDATLREVLRVASHGRPDRVECLWEPGVVLAARLREALGVPGMRVEQAIRFRDKEQMKAALDAAGIRTPRHARATTESACREAAERIGFPLIVKPIAGAGSADTHRVEGRADLERLLPRVRHVEQVSVEEFIDGEEYTFDTICAGGRILYHNVSWYRPRPLIGRSLEWVSPQTVALREPDREELAPGRAMGRAVIDALRFEEGFSHMEWFLTPRGEAVFGEIAARPPGALSVDVMNYSCDIDTYRGWAEAVISGRLGQPVERRYNAAVIFKRAQGSGRIREVRGLERLVSRFRPHVVDVDLLPVGAPRRDWKQTLLSDGHIIVRHPDLQATLEMADRVGTDVQLFAE